MNLISVEERTALMLRFCEKIEEAGYTPMLYHNTEMSAIMIDIAAFEKYDKWYASYSSKMFYPYAYSIWQYSNKGKVNGISTAVDLNICFEPVWEQMILFADLFENLIDNQKNLYYTDISNHS